MVQAVSLRSRIDYNQILNGDFEGFNLGLDGSIFLRKEDSPRVFKAPRVGTPASSLGDASASTDISAGSNLNLKVQVSGGPVLEVALTLAGLTTGDAIAAELKTKINEALLAANRDERVTVVFVSADSHYEIYTQYTGKNESVVVTAGDTNDVSLDLKLGVANGGTESVGTDDVDFLLYTTGGPTFNQPAESNTHRSGRFHTNIIKKKKVVEFDIDTFINLPDGSSMTITAPNWIPSVPSIEVPENGTTPVTLEGNLYQSTPGARDPLKIIFKGISNEKTLDNAIKLLLESSLGTLTETTFDGDVVVEQGLPNIFFSMVRVSTLFGEYYRGCYVKDMSMEFPGDGPATVKYTGMGSDRGISGISRVDGVVSASTSVVVESEDQASRYTKTGLVMILDTDGRTILDGYDGDISIESTNVPTKTLTVSRAVDAPNGGLVVPWHPGAVQETGRDNIYTDLEGSFKTKQTQTASKCTITSMSLNLANDHVDLNNRFGKDANLGFVAGNRMTAGLSVEFDLSNEMLGEVIQTQEFGGLNPEIVLGSV